MENLRLYYLILIWDLDNGGDVIFNKYLEMGRLNDVMIIGMSGEHDADKHWTGKAHDFLYKGGIRDIGETIEDRYAKFQKGELKRLGE